MVEYLLNRSADINCQDNEGWTPLHAAASCGNLDIVKYLLSRGAIVDVCNNEGELPIDIAEGDEIIGFLEDDMRRKGIDDEQARNSEHHLMLKHAQDLFNNNQKHPSKPLPETIVHARTGATALHVAAAKGYLDVIDILIRAGANINAVDNDGWTPLHAAAHWDKHDVIHFLLEKNADLDAKNYAGQAPLDVCDGLTYELLKEIKDKRPSVVKTTTSNETPDNILAPWKRKPTTSRSTDEHKSILRSESHNENLETSSKASQSSSSSLPMSINPPSLDEHLSNGSLSIKEKLTNLQRSLHDLSNRYSKGTADESTNSSITSLNNDLNASSLDQRTKSHLAFTSTPSRPNYLLNQRTPIPTSSQRTFTNPLQSLTTNQFDFSSRETPTNANATATTPPTPTPTTDQKINRRWGTTEQKPADGSAAANNTTVPYVRRRSAAGVSETSAGPTTATTTTTTTSSAAPALVSVTTSFPSVSSPPTATTNVTVTSSPADDSLGGKRRSNVPPSRDEEAEAQRKHRSAVARRERRSTQSVTQEDIKAAEQQIKSRPSNSEFSSPTPPMPNPSTTTPTPATTTDSASSTLANNKIGAPSTPSTVAEHDIETERLQRVIEEKKDKARRSSGGNEDIAETTVDPTSLGSRRIRSRFTTSNDSEKDPTPTITANDSLNLGLTSSLDSQQQQTRRRTNRVHNQRKNTGRIIWNDETKEVEIRDDSNDLISKSPYGDESHRSDEQKLAENAQQSGSSNSGLLGSRGLISRFENPLTTTTSIVTKDSSPTSPTSRINRSQSQDPSRKSLTSSNSLPSATATTSTTPPNTLINGMATSTPFAVKKESKENSTTNSDNLATKRLYEDSKRKIDELTQKIDRMERDILERDQMIEKLKTSQYIESSLDKREKRAYERKISELEEELKKLDSIKADNSRLKEENAALIRVISKLSK